MDRHENRMQCIVQIKTLRQRLKADINWQTVSSARRQTFPWRHAGVRIVTYGAHAPVRVLLRRAVCNLVIFSSEQYATS